MMGKSHALCGLTVGVLAAGALDHAPWPVRLMLIPVCGGAALLPDLDHPSGTAARSLGPITKFLTRFINALSLQVYHATRAPGDSADRRDGHRLVTHTIPGCLAVGIPGVLVHVIGQDLALAFLDPAWAARIPGIFTALTLGICLGLLARTSRSLGALFTVLGTGISYWVVIAYPGWWGVWPAALVLGCLTHLVGDIVTVSGIPICWPLTLPGPRGPRRWAMISVPGSFSTGTSAEKEAVVPLLTLGLILAVGISTGALSALLGALWGMASA